MKKGFIRRLLIPREDKFYPMFEEMAELTLKAAQLFAKNLDETDLEAKETIFREIKLLETKADDIVHQVFDRIDTTFITPFDREDIQKLTVKMDDVLDNINTASQQIRLYKPVKPLPQFRELNLVLVRGCEQIRIAIMELRNLSKPDKINDACVKIHELENLADDIYHRLISELFEQETDAVELIKNKEILETLEFATDRIEDVSDVLKTIIIKSA
jgi:predicted phosphate transport protein (TIGR00153 family)